MLTTDLVTKQVFGNLDVDVGKKKKTPLDNITQKPSEEPDLKWNLLWVTPDIVIMADTRQCNCDHFSRLSYSERTNSTKCVEGI